MTAANRHPLPCLGVPDSRQQLLSLAWEFLEFRIPCFSLDAHPCLGIPNSRLEIPRISENQ